MLVSAVRQRINGRLRAKAASLLISIEGGLDRIMIGWLLVAGLASALRIATSPAGMHGMPGIETLSPYLLLILAPFASMVLALRWFADGESQPQPEFRLARVGHWRRVGRDEAMRHPLYGAGGIMVSLLVGILLNVAVRAMEFLTSMPALSGPVPNWLSTLHIVMTVDVIVVSSLYTVAFVAALRRLPLFPRLLVTVWTVDVVMQLLIAHLVAGATGLPVAVAEALHGLLEGNLTKVLIGAALWLPYLLLSTRVNVTYRRRVPV